MNELHSCSNCEYLLQLPTGAVCNGLKEPTQNLSQSNTCTSWEQLDREAGALRNRELQERVERPKSGRSFVIGTPFYADDPYSDISQEQIASLRNWASELIDRREVRTFREQYEINPLEPASRECCMTGLTLTKLQEIMQGLPDPEDWWRCSGGSHYQVRISPPISALSWSIDRPMPERVNYKTIILRVRYREGRYCWVYEGEVVVE